MKCNGRLRVPSAEEKALASIAQEVRRERAPSGLGMVVAGIGLLGVVGAGIWVVWMLSGVRNPSAVQVTQVYTQGVFWMLAAVGVLLAGVLWVVSTRE